jgi:hypothetical protein
VLKPNLFPRRRALLEDMGKADLVFEAVRNLPSPTANILPALDKLETFPSAYKDTQVGHVALTRLASRED